MRALVCVVLVAVATPARVYAQPADVPGLIKLIENQPSDMDRSTWKEKRRDAARKLAQSKDKRAVPVLTNLAETETFDIIGDIAIEGLGTLKDQAAVPVLQKIVGDVSRDKSSRELARKALAKLGAPATPPAGGGSAATGGGGTGGGSAATGGGSAASGGGKTGGGSAATGGGSTNVTTSGGAKAGGGDKGGAAEVSSGGATGGGEVASGLETGGTVSGDTLLGGTSNAAEVPEQPDLGDDVIAAYERLTFVAGTAGLSYDTARSRMDFDADAAGRYQKRVDTETRTLGIDVGADVVAGVTNPEGRGVTRGIVLNVNGEGEARMYAGKLYGIGKLAMAVGYQRFTFKDQNNPDADVLGDDALTGDFQLALGGGYGRVIDVGSAIRVQRLGRLLDAARALGKPIDAATAKKLQLTWWALRGARSSYDSLIATIAILREAGILLGEPNAAITYEILQVLQDTQLYLRPSGLDIQLVFSEGYLYRPDDDGNDLCDLDIASKCGRVEQLIASAGYGAQLDEDKLELSGTAYARYRLFPGDNEPAPWALGATARMRRFTYGAHGEQFGMLDLSGGLALSSDASTADPCDGFGCDTSLRIEGEVGFTYLINQASGLRLAAHVAEDAGEIFFGARLEATYGLLDGLFAR